MPASSEWPALALLGLLLVGFGNGGVVWAEQTLPTGLTAVLASAALQMVSGDLCLVAVGTLRGEWVVFAFSARFAWAMVCLMIAGSVVGDSAYGPALRHLPVSTVSLYAYGDPVVAVLLGTFVPGEPLSPRLAIAGTGVPAGTALVRK